MRGQVWSVDITAATVVMSFIVLFSLIIWNDLAMRWNSGGDYREMHTDALLAAEALMTTGGIPESWEMLPAVDRNITAVGLVNGRNELNALKIEKLVAENASAYGLVKERLGVQRYEFGMRIMAMGSNDTLYEFGAFPGNSSDVVAFERMGILDGEPVAVMVEVWE